MKRILLVVPAVVAGLICIGAGAAQADSRCAPEDDAGISWCADGSWQRVDDRGHLLVFGPDGALRYDLAPDRPWY